MKGSDLRSYSTFRWIMSAPDLPATRRRGVTRAGSNNRTPTTPGGVGHSPVTRHLPTAWVLVAVMGSLAGLFVLAVVGAYTLVRGVFGQ